MFSEFLQNKQHHLLMSKDIQRNHSMDEAWKEEDYDQEEDENNKEGVSVYKFAGMKTTDKLYGTVQGGTVEMPTKTVRVMMYEYRESKDGGSEEIQGTVQEVTEATDSGVGVSRRLTVSREIKQVRKEIANRGFHWTNARDVTLMKLSRKYGSKQYGAIAREMGIDRELVKNRLRKLHAKIKLQKEEKLKNAR